MSIKAVEAAEIQIQTRSEQRSTPDGSVGYPVDGAVADTEDWLDHHHALPARDAVACVRLHPLEGLTHHRVVVPGRCLGDDVEAGLGSGTSELGIDYVGVSPVEIAPLGRVDELAVVDAGSDRKPVKGRYS